MTAVDSVEQHPIRSDLTELPTGEEIFEALKNKVR